MLEAWRWIRQVCSCPHRRRNRYLNKELRGPLWHAGSPIQVERRKVYLRQGLQSWALRNEKKMTFRRSWRKGQQRKQAEVWMSGECSPSSRAVSQPEESWESKRWVRRGGLGLHQSRTSETVERSVGTFRGFPVEEWCDPMYVSQKTLLVVVV